MKHVLKMYKLFITEICKTLYMVSYVCAHAEGFLLYGYYNAFCEISHSLFSMPYTSGSVRNSSLYDCKKYDQYAARHHRYFQQRVKT